jgi:hypothetical protein
MYKAVTNVLMPLYWQLPLRIYVGKAFVTGIELQELGKCIFLHVHTSKCQEMGFLLPTSISKFQEYITDFVLELFFSKLKFGNLAP